MADDMNFESFDNFDDLDWSELEKDVQEAAPTAEAPAAPAGEAPQQASTAVNAGKVGTGSTNQLEIGYLMDVNLQVTVEIGKTMTFINHVLTWDRGSIIELDKLVGEPLNLLVNGKQVARGEVVVVNEKFAIKISEILDPKDRLYYLQG